jgi:hypothetical protein
MKHPKIEAITSLSTNATLWLDSLTAARYKGVEAVEKLQNKKTKLFIVL